jgi:hypothetical protein
MIPSLSAFLRIGSFLFNETLRDAWGRKICFNQHYYYPPANYLNLGFISVSEPNLIMIGLILLFFVLAIVIPFPKLKKK